MNQSDTTWGEPKKDKFSALPQRFNAQDVNKMKLAYFIKKDYEAAAQVRLFETLFLFPL